jgi:RAQPRD family integrative conjugative element protein
MSKVQTLLFLMCISLIPTVSADVWAEREALANVATELSALEALVMTAMARRDSNNRTQFDYQILLDDMRKIRAGIAHHLTVPMEPVVPSTIDALRANYTEHQW